MEKESQNRVQEMMEVSEHLVGRDFVFLGLLSPVVSLGEHGDGLEEVDGMYYCCVVVFECYYIQCGGFVYILFLLSKYLYSLICMHVHQPKCTISTSILRTMWDCIPLSSDEEHMDLDSKDPIASTIEPSATSSISSPLPGTPVDSSQTGGEGMKAQDQQGGDIQPSADGGSEEKASIRW